MLRCATVPWMGEARVIKDAMSLGRAPATERAMMPPRLWPIKWIFRPRLVERFADGFIQTALDEQIGAIGVDTDSREVRPITDAGQPAAEFIQIKIGAQKAGNDNHARSRHRAAPQNRNRPGDACSRRTSAPNRASVQRDRFDVG